MTMTGYIKMYFVPLFCFSVGFVPKNPSEKQIKEFCELKYKAIQVERYGCKPAVIFHPICAGYCRSSIQLSFRNIPKKESCRVCVPSNVGTRNQVEGEKLYLDCNKSAKVNYINVPVISNCKCQDYCGYEDLFAWHLLLKKILTM